jgi:hypothetical protein
MLPESHCPKFAPKNAERMDVVMRKLGSRPAPRSWWKPAWSHIPQSEHTMNIFYIIGVVVVIIVVAGYFGLHV